MNVVINGESQVLADGMTVADLLRRLDAQPVRVAVEINKELVSRRAFEETNLTEGDAVEVVTLVGGG